ncbi:MAG TPA: hypothetical protein VGP47_08425 [Parachlamydiaceae bacterium]|nr:hypothetical protein [Parachlamydiaceae bacterium]
MTSITSNSSGNTFFNITSDFFEIANISKTSSKFSSESPGYISKAMYYSYNTFKYGLNTAASTINSFAGPTVGFGGRAVKWLFNEKNYHAASAATATVAFGCITYKGLQMAITPISSKASWIRIDNRFTPKFELKSKLVNLSELVGKISPDVLPGTTQVNALAGVTSYQANKTAEDLQIAANNDQAAAAKAILDATQDLADANTAKGLSDQAQIDAVTAETNAANAQTHATNLLGKPGAEASREVAARLGTDAITARQKATALKEDFDKKQGIANLSGAAIQIAQDKADKAKVSALAAKKQADVAKAQAVVAKKKEDTSIPEGNHLISYNVEKSRPKPGETYGRIPFSNYAVFINYENLKKDLLRSSSGLLILTGGALGSIGSASETEKAMFGTNLVQKLSQATLGNGFTNAAWIIRKPLQVLSGTAGQAVSLLLSYDTYGLSKLSTAAALGFAGYRLFSGGLEVRGYGPKAIDGTWFDFKKANPTDPIVKVDVNVFLKDVTKAVAGTALIGAAILSVNDFFSGNY